MSSIKRTTFLSIYLLISFVSLIKTQNSVDQCLHKGCELTPGISESELNDTIKSLLSTNESHFEDNMLRFMTWNLNLTQELKEDWPERKEEICSYIISIQPSILSLQSVSYAHFEELEKCLENNYKGYIGGPDEAEETKIYNPTFVKYWRKLRVGEDDTFWISDIPENEIPKVNNSIKPITCNWMKVRFAERKSWRHSVLKAPKRSFAERVLRLLKRYITKFQHEVKDDLLSSSYQRPRTKYQWKTFYVATVKVHSVDSENQIKLLLSYLRNAVMQRRRYPVFLMGNFGFEDNSSPYQILNNQPWLKNAMLKARAKYPAFSLVKSSEDDNEGLVDHIWINRFNTVLTGTLKYNKQPFSRSRPIFSAAYASP